MSVAATSARKSTTIPAEAISNRYDFVYYFEAVDGAGNAAIYPDWEVGNPYVIVRVEE